uniref:Bm536 n=1 Tax=Brugia malayi TaxID=6279 RepID=A0A0I9N9L3_BRUMA|nr:Bm536 [Brugia malayi]
MMNVRLWAGEHYFAMRSKRENLSLSSSTVASSSPTGVDYKNTRNAVKHNFVEVDENVEILLHKTVRVVDLKSVLFLINTNFDVNVCAVNGSCVYRLTILVFTSPVYLPLVETRRQTEVGWEQTLLRFHSKTMAIGIVAVLGSFFLQ